MVINQDFTWFSSGWEWSRLDHHEHQRHQHQGRRQQPHVEQRGHQPYFLGVINRKRQQSQPADRQHQKPTPLNAFGRFPARHRGGPEQGPEHAVTQELMERLLGDRHPMPRVPPPNTSDTKWLAKKNPEPTANQRKYPGT